MAGRATARLAWRSALGLGLAALLFSMTAAAGDIDSTPPALSLYAPADGARLPDDRVIVFGATERSASVAVNGLPAAVNIFDGTFELRDLSLPRTGTGCLQPAVVTVTATDAAGNAATVSRSVVANHCVTHPALAYPLPDIVVSLGQSERVAINLGEYFTDDGGSALLSYSTYVVGASSPGFSLAYSLGSFSFAWSPEATAGTYAIKITARDRDGEVSDSVQANLVVVSSPFSNRAPEIALVAPPEELPVGGRVNFVVRVSDPDGDAFTVTAKGASAGTSVLSVAELSSGEYSVAVTADGAARATGTARVEVTAVDGRMAPASIEVALVAYDSFVTPDLQLTVPAVPELYLSDLEAPLGAPGVFAEFSAARRVQHLYLADPALDPVSQQAAALNDDQTYWRIFVELPREPGVYARTLWAGDPGLQARAFTFVWTVLADPLPPAIQRLVPVTGSLALVEGETLSMQWVGDVPDAAQTTFEWAVDGGVVARTPQLEGVVLEPGAHTVTVTATSPGGSSSSSASVTVSPSAGPALPPTSTPWLFYFGLAGLVVVGLILAGTEIGIYLLIAGLFGAIIDREAREKLLTHFVRGRIYQIIEYEPGVHLSELQRKAGVARGVCAYHLHALEKAGLVKTMRDGMFLRFYATKVKIDAEAYSLAADDRAILKAIESRPGITEREVAELLGKSSGQVARSVKVLAQSGYVEARRAGEAVQLFPRTQRGEGAASPQ